jgi:hypothetical protein
VLTALAVTRGGEVAFLWYDLCWWDDIFQCLEAIWSQLKTTMQQSIYFQGYCDGYLCNIYHSMGCFFSVQDGLLCFDSRNPRINRVVYPDSAFTWMFTALVKYSLILILVIIYVHLAIPFHQPDTFFYATQCLNRSKSREALLYILSTGDGWLYWWVAVYTILYRVK